MKLSEFIAALTKIQKESSEQNPDVRIVDKWDTLFYVRSVGLHPHDAGTVLVRSGDQTGTIDDDDIRYVP
jgi:hypothetical protein